MPNRWLPEFEWDEHNEDKLLDRHGVTAAEAEECFGNANSRRRVGDVYLMLGMTEAGRMLFLVYEQKRGGRVRVFSAREMTDAERRTYRRVAR
ncbi:MAG: BrnT family toxin [Candidatus Limnocylindria bacterium]